MIRKLPSFIFLALLFTGCSKQMARQPQEQMLQFAVSAALTQHYIAERDTIEILTSESDLQKNWESTIAFCDSIQCEVVSSSITARTANTLPSGIISLRVTPDDLKKLISHLENSGKISQHTTDREDKTTEVIDTDAKIKNLTSFRDSLRAMLAKPSATVGDSVEIQKQLTETQSELDSETSKQKVLASETEKIAVQISYHVANSTSNGGGFSQIWNALRESGSDFADSTAFLITTIVSVIPWLILILPCIWLLAKAWKKLKIRRNRVASSQ